MHDTGYIQGFADTQPALNDFESFLRERRLAGVFFCPEEALILVAFPYPTETSRFVEKDSSGAHLSPTATLRVVSYSVDLGPPLGNAGSEQSSVLRRPHTVERHSDLAAPTRERVLHRDRTCRYWANGWCKRTAEECPWAHARLPSSSRRPPADQLAPSQQLPTAIESHNAINLAASLAKVKQPASAVRENKGNNALHDTTPMQLDDGSSAPVDETASSAVNSPQKTTDHPSEQPKASPDINDAFRKEWEIEYSRFVAFDGLTDPQNQHNFWLKIPPNANKDCQKAYKLFTWLLGANGATVWDGNEEGSWDDFRNQVNTGCILVISI